MKLIDLGFAKKLKNDKRTMTICGTPDYLAPEVLTNKKKGYGKSVDLWAMGVLVYEMMVGVPPFYDSNPMSTYKRIVKQKPFFPSTLSEEAQSLLQDLLQKCPEKRMESSNFPQLKNHLFFQGLNFE